MKMIDADELDDTIIRLNAEGWDITRSEYKIIAGVLHEMPSANPNPVCELTGYTNGEVFKSMLKAYFPKTLFIWSKNEAYKTMGLNFSEEWWNNKYKEVEENG